MKNKIIEVSEKTKFSYDGVAEILHLNTRKEGKEEDGKELAIDVKFMVKMTSDAFSFFECQDLANAFYTDIGAVKNVFIEPLGLTYELKNYRLTVVGKEYCGVTLKKFYLKPIDGNLVSITFQASFKPTSNEVALIAENLQDLIEISVEPTNRELEFQIEKLG
jgi:hypothetical protein